MDFGTNKMPTEVIKEGRNIWRNILETFILKLMKSGAKSHGI